jgi:hypothetical protein
MIPERLSPATATGRLGEIIVTFHLEANGIQTAVVDREEIDLWVRTPSQRMLTVQIKTASAAKSWKGRPANSYGFNIPPRQSSADLFALVALDRGIVLFYPRGHPRLQSIHSENFTREAMQASIAEHLR